MKRFLRRWLSDPEEEKARRDLMDTMAEVIERQGTTIDILRDLLSEKRPAPVRREPAKVHAWEGGASKETPQYSGPTIREVKKRPVNRDPGPLPGYDQDQIERAETPLGINDGN